MFWKVVWYKCINGASNACQERLIDKNDLQDNIPFILSNIVNNREKAKRDVDQIHNVRFILSRGGVV